MQYKGFIFDLDGTLLDSMDVWARIDERFLYKRGLSISEDYITQICARSFQEAAEYTIDLFHLNESAQSIMEEWNAMALYEYSRHVGLTRGALVYLQRLKASGKKLAIATGLPRQLFQPCLRNNGIYEMFEAIYSSEQCQAGKESPEIFLRVARALGLHPQECVVFEDVLPAIRSAKSIGMRVYGVFDKYSQNDKEAIISIADGCITDFSEAPSLLGEE